MRREPRPREAAVAGGRLTAAARGADLVRSALQAYRFDPAAGRTLGDPVVVAQNVNSAGMFGASANGVLAYRTGTAQIRPLLWVDRTGRVLQEVSGPRAGRKRPSFETAYCARIWRLP